MLLFLTACTPTEESWSAADITVGAAERMVPPEQGALPSGVVDQASNNNLDVVRFENSLFLAFRTAPSHFASTDTALYVLRSDEAGDSGAITDWTLETTVALGTDLREPRFLALDDELLLYFAVLGEDASDFEPKGAMLTARTGASTWSAPEWVFEDSFIPWRIHPVEGGAQMLGYTGGGEIYDFGVDAGADDTGGSAYPAIEVRWLASGDGRNWGPAVGDDAVVQVGGGSETDWTMLDDGDLVAVTRNEAGDASGFGSKICRAEAAHLEDWACVSDPRKYDSPLVFRENGRTWLVGRRNVTETGAYDLADGALSFADAAVAYAVDYWGQPKRCSLWEVDEGTLEVRFVLDLPSRGDTCFPSALPLGDGRWDVWNYSSPVDGPDVSWLEGQMGTTYLYRQTLDFHLPAED